MAVMMVLSSEDTIMKWSVAAERNFGAFDIPP